MGDSFKMERPIIIISYRSIIIIYTNNENIKKFANLPFFCDVNLFQTFFYHNA